MNPFARYFAREDYKIRVAQSRLHALLHWVLDLPEIEFADKTLEDTHITPGLPEIRVTEEGGEQIDIEEEEEQEDQEEEEDSDEDDIREDIVYFDPNNAVVENIIKKDTILTEKNRYARLSTLITCLLNYRTIKIVITDSSHSSSTAYSFPPDHRVLGQKASLKIFEFSQPGLPPFFYFPATSWSPTLSPDSRTRHILRLGLDGLRDPFLKEFHCAGGDVSLIHWTVKVSDTRSRIRPGRPYESRFSRLRKLKPGRIRKGKMDSNVGPNGGEKRLRRMPSLQEIGKVIREKKESPIGM